MAARSLSKLNHVHIMKYRIGLFALLAGLTLAAPALDAAEKTISLKLSTLAPAGTSYHKSLQAMGENGARPQTALCNWSFSPVARRGARRTWWD